MKCGSIISCFLLALLSNSITLIGQNLYNLPPKKSYESAIIGLINFDKFDVKKLTILTDSVMFETDGSLVRLHLNEINYIRVREGTGAGGGALIGGASMLVISGAALLSVANDPNYDVDDNAGQTVVLLTLGGTVLGALIGATIQKSKSYYIHSSSK